MTHVITGSKGFLGRHLMAALPGAVGLDLPECDVLTSHMAAFAESVFGHIDEHKPSTVWHLAALNGSTQGFYDRPWDVLNVQVRGTLNVIDACVANGVKTLVLFSSSEVYQSAPVPTPEDVPFSIPDIKNPRFSYALGKQASEGLAWWSAIPRVIVCRPHNVVGPGQRPGHVWADIIERIDTAERGAIVEVKGDARAERSFCYIDDFIRGVTMVERHHSGDERTREIYHIGDKRPVTMAKLANAIAGALGREDVGFQYTSAPPGSPLVRCPDTTKMQALGWGTTVPFTEALKRTVTAYREAKGC